MNNNQTVDTPSLIRTKREVSGISATLLPFTPQGEPDWDGFRSHVSRTADAGLTPAVNMDTGYINLLDDDTRLEVLAATRDALDGRDFVAGTFVGDSPGDALNLDEYRRHVDMVQDHGGAPVVFQSYGMTQQGPEDILASYSAIGRDCPEFIAFELGTMFAPFGQIYDLETYAGLLDIPQCTGAKHSSLDRSLEWERLALRDERRPNFKVYTGNDLGIDMIIYGSDYLLGLSTFAPEHFALRDAMWASGDPDFHALNDLLQYLGFFAFRDPVPAYKHSAAQFLEIRGRIDHNSAHPGNPKRPGTDVPILRDIAQRLQERWPV